MEDLNHKYENFKKCYEALGKVIDFQKELESMTFDNPVAQDFFNAGVIKQFELAYETGWKFLKEYLAEKYNHEALSPKVIFRACQDFRIFPQNMVNELITLADARNETTHIYNQILAQEVCNSIEKHYQVFGKILEIIKL
jgi:nucleotidyltransferase substrate binding protein (TIGR01987 family)